MQAIDSVWIIGLAGIFYFLFIKKEKNSKDKL